MIEHFILIALYQICFILTCYVISIHLNRNDVADVAWGIGFVIISWISFFISDFSVKKLLVTIMVTLWGLRLSIHILLRNIKKDEDFRYKNWRNSWKNFYLRSFLQIYLLQGVIMYLMSIPIIIISTKDYSSFLVPDLIAIIIWIFGFIYQIIADYQLKLFAENSKNKGKILQHGLWKFSRHPNYFGEILIWWGIFFFTVKHDYILISIISPLLITYLIIFVSGVPMLEKKYKNNQEYQDYKRRTNAIFPFFKR